MKEVVIKSFEHLQEVVFKDCYDEKIGRYRNEFVYRGLSNKEFSLQTSFQRVCSHDLDLERSVIRSFIKYGYADLKDTHSIFQILAVGQHYGLPTRLLDWTYSPLIAAHFATCDLEDFDKDAVIYCVDTSAVRNNLPKPLRDQLIKERANIFTSSMLDHAFPSLDSMSQYSKDPYVVFFEPASQTDRMANQYGLFSVASDVSANIQNLLPKDDKSFYKLIIPSIIKLEIRDKLDYINISERNILPGLDGICKWITRHYSNLND